MKNVDSALQPYRINGSVRVALLVLDHFHHACRSKSLEGLRGHVLFADLRKIEGKARFPLHSRGIAPRSFFAEPIHHKGFGDWLGPSIGCVDYPRNGMG